MPIISVDAQVDEDESPPKVLFDQSNLKVIVKELGIWSVWRLNPSGDILAAACPYVAPACRQGYVIMYDKDTSSDTYGVIVIAEKGSYPIEFFELSPFTLNYMDETPYYYELGGGDHFGYFNGIMDGDGNIYIFNTTENRLESYDKSRNLRWHYDVCTDGSIRYKNGKIYIAYHDSETDHDDIRWLNPDNGNYIGGVNLYPNAYFWDDIVFDIDGTGNIFTLGQSYVLKKFNSAGVEQWEYGVGPYDEWPDGQIADIVVDPSNNRIYIALSVPSYLDAEDTGGVEPSLWYEEDEYVVDDIICHADPGPYYRCIQAHTASASNKPPSGENWQTYWEQIPYKYFYAFNQSGDVTWRYTSTNGNYGGGTVACGNYDKIYASLGLTSTTGYLLALSKIGGEKKWLKNLGAISHLCVFNPSGAGVYYSLWAVDTSYVVGNIVAHNASGPFYECILNHVSSDSNRPGTGVNWTTYWQTFTINDGDNIYATGSVKTL